MSVLPDEKPPFLKSWTAWYWIVIGSLALLIILFYFFTKHFS